VKELYIDGNHISHKGLAVMREVCENNMTDFVAIQCRLSC